MAFLIEKLTQKQREQFEMKQIRNPLSPVLGFLKPSEWIIDIGKDVFYLQQECIEIILMRNYSFFIGEVWSLFCH